MTGAELAAVIGEQGLAIGLVVFGTLGAWGLIRSNAKRVAEHLATDDETRAMLLKLQHDMSRESQETLQSFSKQMLGSILDGSSGRGPSLRSIDKKLDVVATTAQGAQQSADRALKQIDSTSERVDLLAQQVTELSMRVDESIARQLESLTHRVDELVRPE